MQRKLIKQGHSTLMISLPTKWLKDRNLKKGDEVMLQESDNNLVIGGTVISKETAIELTLTNESEKNIQTILVNTYRAGYDKVYIHFREDNSIAIITKVLEKYLIGFDIIEHNKKNCKIANISEPSVEQSKQIFEKIFTNTSYIINSTMNRLQKGINFPDYENMIFRTFQYDNFCRRLIAKNIAPIHLYDKELVWSYLSSITHALEDLYQLNLWLDNNKIKLNHPIIRVIPEIFSLLQKGYATGKIIHMERIQELTKNIEYESLHEKQVKQKHPIAIYYLTSTARKFTLASDSMLILILKHSDAP